MRILAVSDEVTPTLYDHFDAERWRAAKIDLLISCGDLSAGYLSYLVSCFNIPLFYVPGNHDENYKENPPEGGEAIDGKLVVWQGLRILGLGGAPWYNDGAYQYSEAAMARRIFCLKPRIWLAGGVDLVVTHAPPRHCPLAFDVCNPPSGVGRACRLPDRSGRAICQDASDRTHRGFPAFTDLIRAYHPKTLLHGHSHLSYGTAKRVVEQDGTRIIDVHGYYLLDL
ncbi:MAG TPA: metallophosphoesterase [Chloroflexota bacterium]|nr:metallophosphoesterase [Chloroflexota bacterium]